MPKYKTSKEEILKNAYNVFLEKGYYHTSVSDLSKACNIEKAHFYYYFKDKRDLMLEVLKFISDWADKNMFSYAYDTSLQPQERMSKILEVLEKIYSKNHLGCIFGNTALETANNDDEFLPVLKNYFNNWKKALVNIYQEKYNMKESEELADRFFSELNGTVLMLKVYKDHKFIKTFINNHLKQL